ncbi:MAG: tRNA (adenosine(37)-N6)-threonylcarbamoyltransferase complex ATPase subunit type 1 TsaE [Armatimonadota bacterium]|nr:tRNA (adenosine(37)-N6)-threonylcarbamoyltransferase complex ATPase subunit type 1 TsaE [Armatimonadota bacterium]MDR7427207.1 tRNA (adenosine(37)-N6)-threonylcarbamoyltransferase complex ATPase subunit type 1 TsaE [Armatimonadota bacterium]MDR7465640.1 tRNA (adenosine(37)-N6)-threonylcarbamoyltransferase complex ATPase subunit type 1 TsaE [Armatimonadota bacterium]MDR7470483.1 tRNA (adenosine(37)-N6)-threonylcarbamoyltransferase complex ATPase subunit type 1 TsaE [Armatimonadota bacterium]M
MSVVICTGSEKETLQVGRLLGRHLRRGDVVALSGELGTGKTVLARGIAAGAGAAGYIASPTFTLIREYAGPVPVYHVDLFRLEPAEAAELGLEELVERGITVIEWAEKAAPLLRPPLLQVEVAYGVQPEERVLRLRAAGEGPAAAVAAVAAACSRTAPARA